MRASIQHSINDGAELWPNLGRAELRPKFVVRASARANVGGGAERSINTRLWLPSLAFALSGSTFQRSLLSSACTSLVYTSVVDAHAREGQGSSIDQHTRLTGKHFLHSAE